MTLFEYVSVAVSIVLSLSAAQLLRSVRHILAPDRRFWILAAWVAFLLYLHLMAWWVLWSLRDFESWNLAGFATVLVSPAFLYLCSTTLVSDAPASVGCWEEHFDRVRPWFFGFYMLLYPATALREWVFLGTYTLDTARTIGWNSILYLLAAAIFPNRLLQAAVLALELAYLIFLGFQRFEAGAI